MKLFNIVAIGLILMAFNTAQAETIHGVCDDLQGAPKGAYGLCVAICEVPAEGDDCIPQFVDGVLVEESLDNCRPAARKLVANFLTRTDSELPCGDYVTADVCPCPFYAPSDASSLIFYQDGRRGVFVTGILNSGEEFRQNVDYRSSSCLTGGLTEPPVVLPVNDEELAICVAENRAFASMAP